MRQCIIYLFGALLTAGLWSAADTHAAEEHKGVVLEVRVYNSEILLYEPLIVFATLVNRSNVAVVANPILQSLVFHCSDDWGNEVVVRPGTPGIYVDVWTTPRVLEPDRERIVLSLRPNAKLLLLHREENGPESRFVNAFVFGKPGHYVVRARITAVVEKEEREIVSEGVGVFVKPVPAAQAPAAKYAAQEDTARALQGWWSWIEGGQDKAREVLTHLVTEFPTSPYADHAHYSLSRLVGDFYGVDEEEQFRRRSQALSHLSAVSPRIGGLRMFALLQIGWLLASDTRLAEETDVRAVIEELEGYQALAQYFGLEEERARRCKALARQYLGAK